MGRPTEDERSVSPRQRSITPSGKGLGVRPDGGSPLFRSTDSIVMSIRIVAHASPRFTSARTREEAKQRNKQLADARAAAVLVVLKRLARDQFDGRDRIEFEYDVSHADTHDSAANVIMGTESQGDVDSLRRAKGDTAANDQFFRRVDVTIQFSVKKIVDAGRTTTKIVQPLTRDWEVAVTGMAGGGIALGAAMVFFLLRNRKTQQVVKCSANLYGGSTPELGGGGSAQKGSEKWVFFKTEEPVGWDDFKGTTVTMTYRGISYIASWEKATLSFTQLGADDLDVSGWATGGSTPGLSAWIKSGKLDLKKPRDKVVPTTEHDFVPTVEADEVFFPIYFDTDKSKVTEDTLRTLGELVQRAAAEFKQRRGL